MTDQIVQEFWTKPHLTHERNGGSTMPRARISTRQPVEIVTLTGDRPMARRYDYDAHSYECGGVMGIGAPLHNPRAVMRRRERAAYVGKVAFGMARFGFTALGFITMVHWLIRGIAGIGG